MAHGLLVEARPVSVEAEWSRHLAGGLTAGGGRQANLMASNGDGDHVEGRVPAERDARLCRQYCQ